MRRFLKLQKVDTHIYHSLYKTKEVNMNRNRRNENFQKYCLIYYNGYRVFPGGKEAGSWR